ncbi:DUF6578 domain-containing protein [Actinoplanes regularis]|uniref:DUF6578 domain-containing protein n=1 Tax=Actinoplanes regularis TaxID=52697 RepID=UPI0024A12861|nr:DUF6578 domain-containing protein [Actinoplanes regularis]GLW34559.1 hypothetical protein Areg01_74960 [Actinoplanes regularis]
MTSAFTTPIVTALSVRARLVRRGGTEDACRAWQTRLVQLSVWMEYWQMECCGTPFRKDSEVSWRLRPAADVDWLDTVLEDGVAATIDAVEDHHGGSSAPPTVATVVSIATVHCRFVPEPVAGSGVMTPVDEAKRWNSDLGDRRFAGFLVRLLTPETNDG